MKEKYKKTLNLMNTKFEHYLTKTLSNLKRVFHTDKIEIRFRRSSRDKVQTTIKVTQGRAAIQASGFGESKLQSLSDARRNIKNKYFHKNWRREAKNGAKSFQKNQKTYEINNWDSLFENTTNYQNRDDNELGGAA